MEVSLLYNFRGPEYTLMRRSDFCVKTLKWNRRTNQFQRTAGARTTTIALSDEAIVCAESKIQ